MRADSALRRMFEAIRNATARRCTQRIELVAWRPLHGGSVMYVADFDRRRHAFVVTPNAVCLLASYPAKDAAQTRTPTGVRSGAV